MMRRSSYAKLGKQHSHTYNVQLATDNKIGGHVVFALEKFFFYSVFFLYSFFAQSFHMRHSQIFENKCIFELCKRIKI